MPPLPKTMKNALLFLLLAGCGASAPPMTTTTVVASCDTDLDSDGASDADDLCAGVEEDRDGFYDHDGCPDLDDDGDRIVDTCDSCPRQAEDYNGNADEDGCPDDASAARPERRALILDHVTFARDAADLREGAYPALITLAASLRSERHLERIVVVGLAAAGEPDPEALSTERAERVRTFLAAHGVDRARLVARGFGTNDPLPATPPWPVGHSAPSVWFIVEQADGHERYVLDGSVYVARDASPLGPETRATPPRAPLCPPR
jgi:outer membrane protein OmpA-like peptidoglycan-associated protein